MHSHFINCLKGLPKKKYILLFMLLDISRNNEKNKKKYCLIVFYSVIVKYLFHYSKFLPSVGSFFFFIKSNLFSELYMNTKKRNINWRENNARNRLCQFNRYHSFYIEWLNNNEYATKITIYAQNNWKIKKTKVHRKHKENAAIRKIERSRSFHKHTSAQRISHTVLAFNYYIYVM